MSTPHYCSRVSFRVIHFRSRKALAVGCGYLSGRAIASLSVLSPRTLTFEWYNPRAPPAAPRACFVDCTHHRMPLPTCHRPCFRICLVPATHVHAVVPSRSLIQMPPERNQAAHSGVPAASDHATTRRATAAASQKNEAHTPIAPARVRQSHAPNREARIRPPPHLAHSMRRRA